MESTGKKKPPNAGKGRIKGSKNQFTQLRDDFLWMYQQLGGKERALELLKGSKKLEKDFIFRIIPSMLPKPVEVSGSEDGVPIKINLIERFIVEKKDDGPAL